MVATKWKDVIETTMKQSGFMPKIKSRRVTWMPSLEEADVVKAIFGITWGGFETLPPNPWSNLMTFPLPQDLQTLFDTVQQSTNDAEAADTTKAQTAAALTAAQTA